MNLRMIARLVGKDCSLMRWPLVGYVAAATAAFALTVFVGGPMGRSAGITLALNVLIGVSFHVLLFLIPATIAATALVWTTPFDIPARMAASHQPLWANVPGTLGYYGLVLGAWILFFSVVLAAAIVTESVGWTVATLSGLLFVVGNFVLQVLPTLDGVARYLRALGRGEPALPITIACEAAGILAIIAMIVMLQRRKTSFA